MRCFGAPTLETFEIVERLEREKTVFDQMTIEFFPFENILMYLMGKTEVYCTIDYRLIGFTHKL